jgi:hypothetical protein
MTGTEAEEPGRTYNIFNEIVADLTMRIYTYWEDMQYIYTINNQWCKVNYSDPFRPDHSHIFTGTNSFENVTHLKNQVFIGDVDEGRSGTVGFFTEQVTFETGNVIFNNGAFGDSGKVEFNGAVDFTNATVTGLPESGGSIDTSDLQVKKLSLLDPGNSVAGYLAPQTSYGGLQLSAKTFVPRIVPTDSIHNTVGQTSPYTTQLLEGGIVLNTSYSETNLDGVIRLIFPTDRLTDQTFATREWVNDRQWSDSNGEPGRVLIDADNIELTLGDQMAGIIVNQYNGSYNTAIWGDSINLNGPVNVGSIYIGQTGAMIEHDGECTTIYDPNNVYLVCDGDNGDSSTINLYNTEINYHSVAHNFTGDITARRSGETTASKVMAAADFDYDSTNHILTIKLS